ncbi:MAG: hypothetical protein HZB39_17285 [Planctomycetes bacterium]|nr:hypothetical protein [Planctomycetota bacterium]
MTRKHFVLFLAPAVVLSGALFSRGSGTFPGSNSIPSDAAQRAPSCTSCHSGTIGGSSVATRLTVADHSLAYGESIQTSVAVSGPSGSTGGFIVENSAGTFTAGTTSRTNTSGRLGQFVTHNFGGNRSWTFSYAAPNVPGLVRLYAVALASNGSGTGGDVMAFQGFNSAATEATPVYVGVNAPGNLRYGQGCVGGYGNWPVLYADQTPTVGNAAYGFRLAGAAPSTTALFMIGMPRATPLDLALIGANGCSLWVDPLVSVSLPTSAGAAQRGEGTAFLPLGVPGNPALVGTMLATQCAIVDMASGRSMPITTTAALLFTIQ